MADSSRSGSAGDRYRSLRRALLPPIFIMSVLLLAYFSLPFTKIGDLPTMVLLLCGVLAVLSVCVWQIRRVLRAENPVARTSVSFRRRQLGNSGPFPTGRAEGQ
ncbi:hypothetical protein OG874_37005 [Nocardia sp. NBC_00565]|uniref:hypothetical protein n=1 Tax=Nocardia sp. NBC_00565 TaxID=2975993 RepID=UPI002E802B11|nr:hypothetical protein [Nocardia sp. NBC_00565]WUC02275.1 hypothetical protein OG874_37005 [Nocardia sp. NBC_00565]